MSAQRDFIWLAREDEDESYIEEYDEDWVSPPAVNSIDLRMERTYKNNRAKSKSRSREKTRVRYEEKALKEEDFLF